MPEGKMAQLSIVLEGDAAWPQLADGRKVHHTHNLSVSCLPGGMASGKPSVAFKIDLQDGSSVLCETSLQLFLTAADAFRAKYGDPRTPQERVAMVSDLVPGFGKSD